MVMSYLKPQIVRDGSFNLFKAGSEDDMIGSLFSTSNLYIRDTLSEYRYMNSSQIMLFKRGYSVARVISFHFISLKGFMVDIFAVF